MKMPTTPRKGAKATKTPADTEARKPAAQTPPAAQKAPPPKAPRAPDDDEKGKGKRWAVPGSEPHPGVVEAVAAMSEEVLEDGPPPDKSRARAQTRADVSRRAVDAARSKAKATTSRPEAYHLAWKAYVKDSSHRAISEATGLSREFVKRLVEEGVPAAGLPPMRERMADMMKRVQELEADAVAEQRARTRRTVNKGLLIVDAFYDEILRAIGNPDPVIRLATMNAYPIGNLAKDLKVLAELQERYSEGDGKNLAESDDFRLEMQKIVIEIAGRKLPMDDAKRAELKGLLMADGDAIDMAAARGLARALLGRASDDEGDDDA